MTLRPFWRYYGGKYRAAPRYPQPRHGTIIEPFAGSAGYALRYHRLDVVLVERYAVIAEMWRWLVAATAAEVLAIPDVEHVDALPGWVQKPTSARPPAGSCGPASVPLIRTSQAARGGVHAHRLVSGATRARRGTGRRDPPLARDRGRLHRGA